MDKYIKAEKQLAEILGVFNKWNDESYSFNGSMKWARSDEDAFKLLLRYSLELNYLTLTPNTPENKSNKPIQIVQIRKYLKDSNQYGQSVLLISEEIDNHQDVFSAARYSIVCAVISILKENSTKNS